MIDQDKMRALAKALRDDLSVWSAGFEADWGASAKPAADAIDLLLAEVEAAAADKRDAERYRWLRTYPNNVNATIYGPTGGLLRRDEYLDVAIDAALAQRQGEGS